MDELGWRMSTTLCQVLPWGRGLGSKAGSVHTEAQGLQGLLCVCEVRHRDWDESWHVSLRTGHCCQVWFLELRAGASDFRVEPSISPWPSLVGLVWRPCSLPPWLHHCFGMWAPLTLIAVILTLGPWSRVREKAFCSNISLNVYSPSREMVELG